MVMEKAKKEEKNEKKNKFMEYHAFAHAAHQQMLIFHLL